MSDGPFKKHLSDIRRAADEARRPPEPTPSKGDFAWALRHFFKLVPMFERAAGLRLCENVPVCKVPFGYEQLVLEGKHFIEDGLPLGFSHSGMEWYTIRGRVWALKQILEAYGLGAQLFLYPARYVYGGDTNEAILSQDTCDLVALFSASYSYFSLKPGTKEVSLYPYQVNFLQPEERKLVESHILDGLGSPKPVSSESKGLFIRARLP